MQPIIDNNGYIVNMHAKHQIHKQKTKAELKIITAPKEPAFHNSATYILYFLCCQILKSLFKRDGFIGQETDLLKRNTQTLYITQILWPITCNTKLFLELFYKHAICALVLHCQEVG